MRGASTARANRVVQDPAVCVVCAQGPDLLTGALIQLPGTYRWVHRACLERDVELALSTARRVAHVKQRRLAPEVR